MKKLAHTISRIFEPMIVMSVLVVAGTLRSGFVGRDLIGFLLFVLAVMLAPTAVLRIRFVQSQKLDWDIRDRKKRILPLFVLLLLVVVDVALVSLWKNPFLTRMFIIFLAWIAGYFAITLFWKISGHTSVVTLASLLLLDWYGLGVWPILLVPVIVAWARVVGKNHTLGQAVGGIVYSSLLHEVWKSFL